MTDVLDALYVGVNSGTSVDGLDLALIDVRTDAVRVLAGTTAPFDADLRRKLLALGASEINDIDSMGEIDTTLGRAIAAAVLAFLIETGTGTNRIRAIGCHGQTIRHRPNAPHPFTIQIGEPNVVAEGTGIRTVADFRRRDIAAGGEGAPLVPLFHQALFGSSTEPRTVLNIGGIANITTLPRAGTNTIAGFDTGPGNTLLDAWIFEHRRETFDNKGAWAASGRVNPALLDLLLREPYFARRPPKSTGRETFHLGWLVHHLSELNASLDTAAVQATLLELTAVTIANGIDTWGHEAGAVIVAGGGRLNHLLMTRIQHHLPRHSVAPSERFGVNGDWLEAAAFAWLAHRALEGLPGNAPDVTGAAGQRVLGAIYAGG